MEEYFRFLDSIADADELNAPSYLVERFGIEYRIAVEITTEWLRRNLSRSRHVN